MLSIREEGTSPKLLKTAGEHNTAPFDSKVVRITIEEDEGDMLNKISPRGEDPTKGSVLKSGVRASKSMKTSPRLVNNIGQSLVANYEHIESKGTFDTKASLPKEQSTYSKQNSKLSLNNDESSSSSVVELGEC